MVFKFSKQSVEVLSATIAKCIIEHKNIVEILKDYVLTEEDPGELSIVNPIKSIEVTHEGSKKPKKESKTKKLVN
jgi:hypothetical protein